MNYYPEEDEEEVIFGTPFPPLEVEEIVSKKPEIDLTVRDSKGRRRFHGAFTGGFSAGYWMTVGSEEGFTPQQYVSNRTEKWDQSLVQRKPEDFMDSEDMDVFGIAPKRIRTKEKFGEQEFAGLRDSNASLIDVLKSVIKPSVESIGVKLFKQMKRNARNDSNYNETKVYGCEKPSNETLTNDLPFCIHKPKSDFHGIGYKSMTNENSTESMASSGVSAVLSGGRKIKISGEAFGYGVLDEDNEDDAVVYQRDDLSQYDFAIGSVKQLRGNDRKTDKHKAIDVLKTDTIEGFVKCSSKTNLLDVITKKYPIPVLPRNWRPSSLSGETQPKKPRSRWDQTNSETQIDLTQSINTDSSSSTSSAPSKPPVLNANIRAVLLGQEVIHRQGVKQLESEKQPEREPKVSLNEVKEKESGVEKKKEFTQKPLFGFWANKFTRSDTVEESTLSGGLTDFKSSQPSVDSKKAKEQVNETNSVIERTIYEWHPHNILSRRFNIPNPYPQYPDVVGVVTVGKTDVRNRTSHMNAKKSKPNIFECLYQEQSVSNEFKTVDSTHESKASFETNNNRIEANISNDDKDEENDEITRPPMDLFKAIFASDEEDSEDEVSNNDNNSKKNSEENSVTTSDKHVMTTNQNQLSATKAAGIFANIDFDQLNRNFTPILKTNETQKEKANETRIENTNETRIEKTNETQSEKTISESKPNDDFYGPALPPTSSFSNLSNVYTNTSLSEAKTSKSSKRKKKEKKHKKHKKQSSTHKKSKRHRRSSSSSSSDTNVEIKILQHFKNSRK